MSTELLIHSMGEFKDITVPILQAVNAKSVCEIGAEHGGNSKVLHDFLHKNAGTLICIDPAPGDAFEQWYKENQQSVNHINKISLEGIDDVPAIDAWFVDGDHNWYTVYSELNLMYKHTKKYNKPFLAFLHDVGWPCARRDFYYSPNLIPEEYRQPFSYDLGTRLGVSELVKGGFRGNGMFACALQEGGPQNGVLTAVEDFIELHQDEFYWAYVPAVFGLGIIFDRNHPQAAEIADLVSSYHENPLIAKLEQNRLINYLSVIEWQDKFAEMEK